MKTMILALVLSASLPTLAGCAQLKDVIWPTTANCLTKPSQALIEKVTSIVLRDGFQNVFTGESLTALENLAREVGPEAVICIIRDLINAYTAPTGMQAAPDKLAAARRAQDFLNDRQIVVQEKP